ncbi:MAG: protoporphyrinogen oxidase [Xanthomonadales bacterium]|nr:protoporphyrinogen oxidase [Xanthomonadales bacterium]
MRVIIVGAGISGLATAHALLERQPGLDVAVLEAADRTGGKAWTDRTANGYACEWGVNGFLDKEPRTLELAASLGLAPQAADPAAARRYVWRRQTLHRLPESPTAFLTSGMMSLPGRLRFLCEPFIRRGRLDDETLADFARRRLGSEALDALIGPMASGVFAGDPERMSLRSCFPRIHRLEQRHGSLIRGMLRMQIAARRAGQGPGPGPGPGGTLTSFAGGMSELIDGLTTRLGDRIRVSSPVNAVTRQRACYRVHLASGETLETERLVLAAPAWAQSAMLRDLDGALSNLLREIEYPPLAVACLGYRERDLPGNPDGFGYLVAPSERGEVLGTIFDSNVFPGRAPEGHVLLRSMVGGHRNPGLALQDDQALVDSVRAEYRTVLGINAPPEFVRVYRHERAIPQYQVGHQARLEQIQGALKAYPGLVLTGNAFRGVSLNDCVANAYRTAARLAPAARI